MIVRDNTQPSGMPTRWVFDVLLGMEMYFVSTTGGVIALLPGWAFVTVLWPDAGASLALLPYFAAAACSALVAVFAVRRRSYKLLSLSAAVWFAVFFSCAAVEAVLAKQQPTEWAAAHARTLLLGGLGLVFILTHATTKFRGNVASDQRARRLLKSGGVVEQRDAPDGRRDGQRSRIAHR
jgi:hypothetical protein